MLNKHVSDDYQDSNLTEKWKSHREKQINVKGKTQRQKHVGVKRRFFAKMLQGNQASEGLAQSQPAPSAPALSGYRGVTAGWGKCSWRGGRASCHGPPTRRKEMRRTREVRNGKPKRIVQTISASRERSKPKREYIGSSNWTVQRCNNIIRIFFLFLHLHTHFSVLASFSCRLFPHAGFWQLQLYNEKTSDPSSS